MTIRLIKDETTSTTRWYITKDDIFIDGSMTLTESEAIEKYNNYISSNRTSNKITIIIESKINEPNDAI
jgi:hypothetical protein